MRWARVAGIGSALVLGIVAAAGMRLWSVDFEQAFAEAALEFRQATGHEVAVAGDLVLDLSWPPRAVADNLTIANPAWATRPSMAIVQRVEAELAPLPLLAGEVRIRRVVFRGVDLLLERDPDGLTNWTLVPVESRRALPAEWTGVTSSLTDLTIDNGRVSFIDHATNEERTIRLELLVAHAADDEQPIEIEADARINAASVALAGTLGSIRQIGSDQPFAVDIRAAGAGATIAVNGRLAWPADDGPAAALTTTIEGADLSDLGPMLDVPLPPIGPYSASATIGMESAGYRLSALQLRLGRSDVAGEAFIEENEGQSRLVATLTSTRVDLRQLTPAPAVDAAMPSPDTDQTPATPSAGSAMPAITEAQINLSAATLIGGGFDLDRVTADMVLRHERATADSFAPGDGGAAPSGPADGASGDIHLAAEAGSIDPNLARRLLSDQAALLVAETGSDIELDCMAGHFTLAAGMPMAAATVIDTPAASITGIGQVDLRRQTVDLRLTPSAKRPDLAGGMAPVVVRGRLTAPEVHIDAPLTPAPGDQIASSIPAAPGPASDAADAANENACIGRLDAVSNAADTAAMFAPPAADLNEPPSTATAQPAMRKRSAAPSFGDFLNTLESDINRVFDGPFQSTRPTPIIKRESGKLR